MSNSEVKALSQENLEVLEKLLKDLKYGSINIIVQDGKIIQIEKTEKIRTK